jgi:hypothetical protein
MENCRKVEQNGTEKVGACTKMEGILHNGTVKLPGFRNGPMKKNGQT